MTDALGRSFASLQIPNYRRYFTGQIVSVTGNWMQMVAELWLVLTLTDSGVAVGITTALQFAPILMFGALGGLLADRMSKRKLLTITQMLHSISPLTMLALAIAGVLAPWMIWVLVFMRGTVNAVDYPTRQSFVMELVGAGSVVNAVSLNSVLVHSARIIGPAFAGILIATVGVEPCFAVNALSFWVMVWALRSMNAEELSPSKLAEPERGAVRAALRYVRATPELWIPLGLMGIVGTLGFNFQVILPLLAKFTFDGGPGAYAALLGSMGAGAVIGALITGARGRASHALLAGAAIGFGALAMVASGAPTLATEMIVLVPLGAASVMLAATVNSSLQLASTPVMRGRVMALYSIVFLGSTPIGAPLAGWLSEAVDPRAAMLLAGVAGIVAGLAAREAFGRAAVDERLATA